MDREDVSILMKIVFVSTLLILGLGEVLAFAFVWPHNGQQYDVTVIVQAVEKSTTWGEHTYVWGLVYGEQDIKYVFIGYHDFVIGETYHIRFIDRIYYIVIFPDIRAELISKELI